ncbi:hypothetical protein GCM10007389_14610 [Pontibacter akesuensis]|nr:hypothetical protein GCM10007389_14610 [Pontibacter akesuensis]
MVKEGKKAVCGARFILDQVTDHKPWADGDKYVHALKVKNIEYATPFDLGLLAQVGGQYWGMKYMQFAKAIADSAAVDALKQAFEKNKVDHFIPFDNTSAKDVEPEILPEVSAILAEEVAPPTRDSFRIQALLAEIGSRMGYRIWLPKNDRSRVLEVWLSGQNQVLNDLPLNYDIDTIKTIENIDVLWIKGRTIVRAFEIEHTTSIYSGILRMADLMALQPNLNIRAHIVAPDERKAKVMQELSRPVFRHILANTCTFISYTSVEELAKEKRLEYMTDAVLEEFSEAAVVPIA